VLTAPTKTYRHRFNIDWQLRKLWPCPLLITSRHGPRRKHRLSAVPQLLRIFVAAGTCLPIRSLVAALCSWLLRVCRLVTGIAPLFVSRPLTWNESVRHSIFRTYRGGICLALRHMYYIVHVEDLKNCHTSWLVNLLLAVPRRISINRDFKFYDLAQHSSKLLVALASTIIFYFGPRFFSFQDHLCVCKWGFHF
jgi:hypothetical protein